MAQTPEYPVVPVAAVRRLPWWRRAWSFIRASVPRQIAVLAVAVGALATAGHVIGGFIGWWHLYEIAFLKGHGTAPGTATQLEAPRLSFVVLPLVTEGEDAGDQWFADALTADLTVELGRMPGGTVISRDTAFTYKGRQADPREVARQLGVRYAVRGTVRRQTNDVRLTLALVEGDSGRQRWAEQFTLDRADLPKSLDDVVGRVARTLNVELMRAEGQRTSALEPEQVEADDLAMRAYAIWFRGLSRENVLQAWQLLEAAVARDPESIRAWNGIALMAARAAQEHWVADVNAARARQAEALRALERLDPNHVLTLMARNRTYWQRGDFEGLLRLSHAITERMPSHPFGYTQRAWAHINLGQFEECPAPLRKAIQLGPRDTEVPLTRMTLSLCYWLLGRFGEAVEAARLAEQTNAGLRALPLLLVAVLASDGRVDEARRIVDEHKGEPDFRVDARASLLLGKHPRVVEGRERFAATLREMGVP